MPSPGAQTKRRGGAGPAGGLFGGKDPTGRRKQSLLQPSLQAAEHVVVAGGGVIREDGCHQVRAGDSSRREEDAATLAKACGAAVSRSATGGPVERHKTALEREVRRALWGGSAVEDAAALTVAAIAANTTLAAGGRVQEDPRVGECADRPVHIDEAAAL